MWPKTRGQRCQQAKPKRALQEIWMAETKKKALVAFDAFIETWGVKTMRHDPATPPLQAQGSKRSQLAPCSMHRDCGTPTEGTPIPVCNRPQPLITSSATEGRCGRALSRPHPCRSSPSHSPYVRRPTGAEMAEAVYASLNSRDVSTTSARCHRQRGRRS